MKRKAKKHEKSMLVLDPSVCSPQDLKALMLEIREFAKWYSHNAIKRRVRAKKTTEQPELSPAASTLLREWSTQNPLGQRSLDQLIRALEDYGDDAPQISITLAAPPANGLKKTLVAWCRENTSPNVLVTFQFNSALLGGMVIRTGSHVFDWSFRRQILTNLDKFPEALRHVR